MGSDAVDVTVQSAAYDTADVGSGDKTLTIAYAIDGEDSGNYLAPANTTISAASITAAAPTVTLKTKTAAFTDKKIEIDAATVKGVTGGTAPDGAITYTYYIKDTCTDADKTSVDKSGAEAAGGAPKAAGTYYVTASIAASGNYTAATSAAVTLTIYAPSSGEDKASAPVIVDGKTVDMGTSEVKDGTTTVKVDQNKLSEQLKNAKDSVVIPITAKTDTAAAQLVVQNVESMAAHSMTLTVTAKDVSYEIPTGSVDTAAILKNLGASDSAKVPLNVTIRKLSSSAVTIKGGTLMVAPVAFTITATYNGKQVEVDRFESYVQRVIEIPGGVDPKTITTAVVAETNGTQRHVPTDVFPGRQMVCKNKLHDKLHLCAHSKQRELLRYHRQMVCSRYSRNGKPQNPERRRRKPVRRRPQHHPRRVCGHSRPCDGASGGRDESLQRRFRIRLVFGRGSHSSSVWFGHRQR